MEIRQNGKYHLSFAMLIQSQTLLGCSWSLLERFDFAKDFLESYVRNLRKISYITYMPHSSKMVSFRTAAFVIVIFFFLFFNKEAENGWKVSVFHVSNKYKND